MAVPSVRRRTRMPYTAPELQEREINASPSARPSHIMFSLLFTIILSIYGPRRRTRAKRSLSFQYTIQLYKEPGRYIRPSTRFPRFSVLLSFSHFGVSLADLQ